MTTATPTDAALDTARDLYLGWIDASITANERAARVARVWIDETLGAQQDAADALKRAFADTQATIAEAGDTATPFTLINRAGDLSRTAYQVWTEAALKGQERFTRVAQTAFEELRAAGTDIAQRTEQRIGDFTRRATR